eukprot:CAMPEP_0117668674 /NCGR_PEP_ID=MMETSP0804-20121206/11686_1 /TAXON_ID=1074897 /ORGANISM="Tetraselmis astigmatica, Strain CCMP880" /LENGTH=728 /DNA_ID=CAMNT_0005476603 /DNA_START=260 /DNA_END=2446 /DNA_ORIENTATION=+
MTLLTKMLGACACQNVDTNHSLDMGRPVSFHTLPHDHATLNGLFFEPDHSMEMMVPSGAPMAGDFKPGLDTEETPLGSLNDAELLVALKESVSQLINSTPKHIPPSSIQGSTLGLTADIGLIPPPEEALALRADPPAAGQDTLAKQDLPQVADSVSLPAAPNIDGSLVEVKKVSNAAPAPAQDAQRQAPVPCSPELSIVQYTGADPSVHYRGGETEAIEYEEGSGGHVSASVQQLEAIASMSIMTGSAEEESTEADREATAGDSSQAGTSSEKSSDPFNEVLLSMQGWQQQVRDLKLKTQQIEETCKPVDSDNCAWPRQADRMAALEARCERIKEENGALKQQLDEHESRLKSMMQRLSQSNLQRDTLKEKLKEFIERNKLLEKAVAKLLDRAREAEEEDCKLQQKISMLESFIADRDALRSRPATSGEHFSHVQGVPRAVHEKESAFELFQEKQAVHRLGSRLSRPDSTRDGIPMISPATTPRELLNLQHPTQTAESLGVFKRFAEPQSVLEGMASPKCSSAAGSRRSSNGDAATQRSSKPGIPGCASCGMIKSEILSIREQVEDLRGRLSPNGSPRVAASFPVETMPALFVPTTPKKGTAAAAAAGGNARPRKNSSGGRKSQNSRKTPLRQAAKPKANAARRATALPRQTVMETQSTVRLNTPRKGGGSRANKLSSLGSPPTPRGALAAQLLVPRVSATKNTTPKSTNTKRKLTRTTVPSSHYAIS